MNSIHSFSFVFYVGKLRISLTNCIMSSPFKYFCCLSKFYRIIFATERDADLLSLLRFGRNPVGLLDSSGVYVRCSICAICRSIAMNSCPFMFDLCFFKDFLSASLVPQQEQGNSPKVTMCGEIRCLDSICTPRE